MIRFFFSIFLISSFQLNAQTYEDLSKKAVQLFEQSKYPEAITLAIKAKDAAKKEFGENSYKYAKSLNTLADFYKSNGDYAAAEVSLHEVLNIIKKVVGDNHTAYVTILNNLASLYVEMGRYFEAESVFKQVLIFHTKASETETNDYATTLNNLADLYGAMGNYTIAESHNKQVLEIYKKLFGEESLAYGTATNNLAGLYLKTGKYSTSELFYSRALSIIKKILGEEHPDYAISLNNLALLYSKLGNFPSAEELYIRSLNIQKKTIGEQHPDYATTLDNLAALYGSYDNLKAAEPLFKKALAIRKATLGEDHFLYAISLSNLASVYLDKKEYFTAKTLLKEALSITQKNFGEESPDYAVILNNLGSAHQESGDFKTAEALFKKSLAINKKLFGESHTEIVDYLTNLALLYEKTDQILLAQQYLTQANNIALESLNYKSFLSESEKLMMVENEMGNFLLSPSFLITSETATTSFTRQTSLEQMKLKGLVANDMKIVLLAARKTSDKKLQQLLNTWVLNKSILAKQYTLPIDIRIPQLDSLEKITNEQEKQINQQSSIIRTSQQNQLIGFTEVQQQLKKDEAAIEFIRFNYYHKGWTDSVLYAAFVILHNDTVSHFVPLCEEKQLIALLHSKNNSSAQFVKRLYRGADADDNVDNEMSKSDKLYNLVWKPLQPFLNGISKINIAPAGLMNRIAFNALSIDSSAYLIDKYQLRQFTSVREIAEQKIPLFNTSSTDIVLYGGVNFNTSEVTTSYTKEAAPNLPDKLNRSIRGGVWEQLPGTQQEINQIRQLFNQNKKTTQSITGSAATEESLKQLSGNSPKILHLATHGFFLPNAEQKLKDNLGKSSNQFTLADNPLLRSGIIMAGANKVWSGGTPMEGKEDGIVTAYEISNLDLNNTELVVLSACETALGDIRGTEGVFGLQRAFKLAGVQNMILSLWQVPDEETAELMNSFYENKLKGSTNYEAFNKAQDIMRKKYSPFYWAAFVLIE